MYFAETWTALCSLSRQQQQQQKTASSARDALLAYCFLQSGFTSAELHFTVLKSENMLSFIGGQIYISPPLSHSLSLTHSALLSFTRTLSCSVCVPLFLVHTLSFSDQHTHYLPFFLFFRQHFYLTLELLSLLFSGCCWPDSVITAQCLEINKSTGTLLNQRSQPQITWRPLVRLISPSGVTLNSPLNINISYTQWEQQVLKQSH